MFTAIIKVFMKGTFGFYSSMTTLFTATSEPIEDRHRGQRQQKSPHDHPEAVARAISTLCRHTPREQAGQLG
jgi:hypothetical protein